MELDFFTLLIIAYKYIGILASYIILAFMGLLLIQLISYRVFHFNLYKWLTYNLIDKQLS